VYRKHLLTIIAVLAPLAVEAQELDLAIGGNYGSVEGCTYARTGESSGADDFLLLTPHSITASVFACDFKKVLKTSGDSFTVTASCQADGEDGDQEQKVDVTRAGKTSYRVSFEDGTKLGPIKKCP
jgi:hypothetical protein